MLLPYFEQGNLKNLYDSNKIYRDQSPQVASTVIPSFVCPSGTLENPFDWTWMGPAGFNMAIGTLLGRLDYVYCKGATDAWCFPPDLVPATQRGMFDYNLDNRIAQITDGTSNTIAMGEGACGERWTLCQTAGCTQPLPPDVYNQRFAIQVWIMGQTSYTVWEGLGFFATSLYGCTIDRMNKNPVTATAPQTARTVDRLR